MEPGTPSRKWNAQVYHAACEWLVEFRTGEPNEAARKAFHAWLVESPAHMAAYLEMTAIWNESSAVDASVRGSIEQLVEQAREEPDNVVALSSLSAPELEQRHELLPAERTNRRTVRRIALAASIVLALSATLAWFVLQQGIYATGIGEQRSLTLEDGSTVQLNARSKLRVRLSQHERKVELLQGQALFQVAKDPQRPFVVTSDGTHVRAIGTQFDVRKKHSAVVVTVVEGRVTVFRSGTASDRVSPTQSTGVRSGLPPAQSNPDALKTFSNGATTPIYVSAGEQLTTSPTAREKPKPVNPALVIAWTQRQLVFDSTPLADVVEEFNRYNRRPLVIRDPDLENFQIDGVFSSTDPSSLIRFLRSRPGMHVIETDSEIVIASR